MPNPFDLKPKTNANNPFDAHIAPAKTKLPFDATGAGIALNTVEGLFTPTPYLKVAKDIGQGIARSVASVGTEAGNLPTEIANKTVLKDNPAPLPFDQSIPTNDTALGRTLFGGKPIETIQERVRKTKEILSPYVGDTGAKYSAIPLVLGSIGLDLSGFGGKAGVKAFSGEIPESFFKYIAKEINPGAIEETLTKVGVNPDLAKSIAPELAATKTPQEAKDALIAFEAGGPKKLPGEVSPEKPTPVVNNEVPPISETTSSPLENSNQPNLFNQPISPEPSPVFSGVTSPTQQLGPAATPLEKADQGLQTIHPDNPAGVESLPTIIDKGVTDVKARVNALDYMRTPENVLKKIGLEKNAVEVRDAYEKYLTETKQKIDQITNWSKQIPKDKLDNFFGHLNGEGPKDLTPAELKVADEVKGYLSKFADRLGLKPDERIGDYITHLFPPGKGGEINEELAKVIQYQIPGSVYDPFLLHRKGVEGYLRDPWKALDAYTKTAVRKIHMDPALANLKSAASGLELSQQNFVKRFADRVNMRPTELDTLIDNGIKSVVGYKLGVRPTKNITATARKIVSRAKLGLSFVSAVKNLTQGINTFAELGTKYTLKGYMDLAAKGGKELKDNGVLLERFIDDRNYNAIKSFWEKADKVTFWNFEATELINRGAAYYGGKAKALADGATEQEAIDYGKHIAAKTQFQFGSIDTPVGMSSDIVKTLTQFQTYSTKQIEFLAEKLHNKEYASLARYVAAAAIVFGTIGSVIGMNLWDILPSLRFGTPPAADLPVRAFKDIAGTKDQYGKVPSGKARLRDLANAALTDVVPGGTQINRTVGALKALNEGKSTSASGAFQYKVKQTPLNYARGILFGKNNLPEAQKYYNKPTKKTSTKSNPFD